MPMVPGMGIMRNWSYIYNKMRGFRLLLLVFQWKTVHINKELSNTLRF